MTYNYNSQYRNWDPPPGSPLRINKAAFNRMIREEKEQNKINNMIEKVGNKYKLPADVVKIITKLAKQNARLLVANNR